MPDATGRLRSAMRLMAPIMLALLAACSTTEPETTAMTAPPAPQRCPENLAFVKSKLVTPYDQLAGFIGPDELDATFSKPIDAMIERGGGYEPSIASGETTIAEYNDILADEKATRDEYHAMGKDDAWIDLYLSSVRDGVTINQAFVDAARCKQALAQTQQQQN
jgi:hypothetical protein